MSDAKTRVLMTPQGGLPAGNWPERELVPYIPEALSDARVKQAREKALREAAEWCRTHTMDVPMNRQQRKYAGMYCAGEWHSGSHAGLGYEAAILALISEDKSNG